MEDKELRKTEETIDENLMEDGRTIVLMPLLNRFIGSFIDKIIIVLLWYVLFQLLPLHHIFYLDLLFIVSNFIYYLLCETVYNASIGKRLLGGLLINKYGYEAGPGKVFLRALLLFAMMMLSFYFMWEFDLDIWLVILLFFLVLDLPVLICRKSLLDLCTRTMYEKPQK